MVYCDLQKCAFSDFHLQVSFQCGGLEVNLTMVTQGVVLSVALCLICAAQMKNTHISQVSDKFGN